MQVVAERREWSRHLSATMANSCVVHRVNNSGRGAERLLRGYEIGTRERFYGKVTKWEALLLFQGNPVRRAPHWRAQIQG